ncbi:MAG TPA: Ig-like domain-containing protein, partial [Isosphaeraceae bacterium]|nr:Ig-like domain-containing protein [Isosphaeraceae bacterium]
VNGSGLPTGSVQFVIDGSNFGSAVALVNGSASISDAALNGQRQPALDHRGLRRRRKLRWQYLERRFPGCELGEIHSGSDLES